MCYLKTWDEDCGWTGFQPHPRGCAYRFLGVEPCPNVYELITQTGPCGQCPECQPQLLITQNNEVSGENDEAEYDGDLDSDDPIPQMQAVSLAQLSLSLLADYLQQPGQSAQTQAVQGERAAKRQKTDQQDGSRKRKKT